MVQYLHCCLDTNLSGESIAIKSLKKIKTELWFLYKQNEYLNLKHVYRSVTLYFNHILTINTTTSFAYSNKKLIFKNLSK